MNKNKIFKKSLLASMLTTSLILPSQHVYADIFGDVGGFLVDLVSTDPDDVIDWIEDTGESGFEELEPIGKVIINGSGQFIDDLGNVIDDIPGSGALDHLFSVSSVTGVASLVNPVEKSELFAKAMLTGDWNSLISSIEDDAIQIGAYAGATANEIESGLVDFGETMESAFVDTGEFILDSEAARAVGKGLEIVRGALTTCLGSAEAVEYCYDQFVGQLIEFYNLMRAYVAKVTELKGYAKGVVFEETMNLIEEIERKSVKYFMPILDENQDKLDFDQSGSPFIENTSVHEYFEQFSSIDGIRNSLANTSYSYHIDPASACARVAIPVVCDDYENLDDHTINRFDYTSNNLSNSEQVEREALFNALNIKAFGVSYRNASNSVRSESEKTAISDYLQTELYSDIDWSGLDQRIPYIVENEILEGAGGAFIATDTDAIILLNEQLFTDDNSLSTGFNDVDEIFAQGVALEEMGHWLNWRRCKYDNNMMNCANTGDIFGDPGLKFSDSSFIEFNSVSDFIAQLPDVSEGAWSKPAQLSLEGGDTAVYEGNPGLADIQDALVSVGSKVRFRTRVQVGVSDTLFKFGFEDGGLNAGIGSTGLIEVNYTPPKRIKAENLAGGMESYGYNNPDQTLYLGSLGINLALENYIGGSASLPSPLLLGLPLPIPGKVYGEIGLKTTMGISIPLLKESTNYMDGLTNVNESYRDKNIKLFYDASPYAFSYQNLLKAKLSSVGFQLDTTQAVWVGASTSWPANSATTPIAITMAGINIAASGVGCVKGAAVFSQAGLSPTVSCALGGQLASASVLTGVGALFSVFNPNITFVPGEGWVAGIRAKMSASFNGLSAGAEVRFETLNSRWDILNGI